MSRHLNPREERDVNEMSRIAPNVTVEETLGADDRESTIIWDEQIVQNRRSFELSYWFDDRDRQYKAAIVSGLQPNERLHHSINADGMIDINGFVIPNSGVVEVRERVLEIFQSFGNVAKDRIRLNINRLTLDRKDEEGKVTRRLDNLTFAIEPGQFVAIVGGSGAGKSTLLKTLLGIEKATSGKVYINDKDLYQNFDLYRNQIGYVPQNDIIHENLTVEEVLTYAAKLRLSPDINLKQIVNQALNDITMTDRREALIKDLSGGQRKRVSIGVELLADPKLFFLDEPTSGLDPGLDIEMMSLLRTLAHNECRTIILVTHATDNIGDCDRVVFLGKGGKLCYFGTPEDAFYFFQVERFEEIYIKIQDKDCADRYARSYLNSFYFEKYISNNISSNSNNRERQAKLVPNKASSIKQWKTLTERYFKIFSRDRTSLMLALFTAPAGIFLMSCTVDKAPFRIGSETDPGLPGLALQVLFVITCASLWVGLSSSEEIVKEFAIYSRERLANLRLRSYLASKVAVLATLAIIQTILIGLFISIGFKSPNFNLISWQAGIFITTLLTLTASFCLGLLISAAVKNSTQAIKTLPAILIPQIIFSGVSLNLKGISAGISYFMISRWAIGAYGTIVNVNELFPKSMKTSLKDMPFPGGLAYEPTWLNLNFSWLMLLGHITLYLTITAWLLKKKDIL
jgi:ABC transport system ATP-binding/permease protein